MNTKIKSNANREKSLFAFYSQKLKGELI